MPGVLFNLFSFTIAKPTIWPQIRISQQQFPSQAALDEIQPSVINDEWTERLPRSKRYTSLREDRTP